MAVPLSPKRLQAARRVFNVFNFFNSFSFVFVSGSFLTLFAVRLGASNAVVGFLNGNVFLLDVGGIPGGYEEIHLERLAAVDLFPHTPHVECLSLWRRAG